MQPTIEGDARATRRVAICTFTSLCFGANVAVSYGCIVTVTRTASPCGLASASCSPVGGVGGALLPLPPAGEVLSEEGVLSEAPSRRAVWPRSARGRARTVRPTATRFDERGRTGVDSKATM